MRLFVYILAGLIFSFPLKFQAQEMPGVSDIRIDKQIHTKPESSEGNLPDIPATVPSTPGIKTGDDFKAMGIYDFFTDIFSKDEKESTNSLQLRQSRENYLRGRMFFQKNEYGKALRFFEKSSDLDKTALKPRLESARCYLFLSQYKKTIKICNDILERNPAYAPALHLIAKSQGFMNQFSEAEKTLLKILDIEPNNLEALQELGTIYYHNIGDVDKTIDIYNRILALKSKDIMALVILGSAYAIKGDVDKSLDYYSTAVYYRPNLVASYINLAKLFRESKNYEGAKKAYYKALMTDPENEEIIKAYQSFLRLQAIRKYGSKKVESMQKNGDDPSSIKMEDVIKDKELLDILQKEFLEGYRELAEDAPTTYTPLISLYADFLMQCEQYNEAEIQYKRILRTDPKNYKAQVALGNIALLFGDSQGAIKAFDQAITINPDNTEVFSHIGAAYLEQKEYQKALDLYEKAALVKPDEENLQVILFSIYEKLKKNDKAENTLKNLVKTNPKRPEFYALLGEFYRKQERPSEALEVYQKAYELKNTSRTHSGMIITLLLELGRKEEAALFAEKAQEFLKQKKEFLIYTGLNFSNFGGYEEALRFFELARDEDPADLVTWAYIAGIYNRMKEFGKAIEIFTELQEKLPDETSSADFYELLGSLYGEQRNMKNAEEAFGKASNLNPQKESVYLSWATLLSRERQDKRIRQILNDAFKHIDRSSDKGMLLEAQIQTSLKEYDRAEFLYKILLEKDPENLDYIYNLGLMYYDAHKFDDAEIYLRKVIEKNPDHAEAYNNLGYMFAEQGKNLDEAEELIKRALYLRPSAAYMIDSLGWVYFQRGEYEKSLLYLLHAERLSLDDAVLFDHLGDNYEKLGQTDKARSYWERAYKLDPQLKGVKEKLGK
ncbi:tetratricopeptide repeat protein [Candidatus Sumerlaeota bacterium]|nr:tetratricopeptide repeat protein [Candidatus Sumerlaeota bacterium]